MESLIDTFHIDVKLLLAQTVNFVIVFGVLFFVALKPLLKVMKERSEKIDKSVKDAERIEKDLEETEQRNKEILSKARKDADEIIKKAGDQADKKREEMISKARGEIGAIINQEKEKIQSEKEKTLKEIRSEVADLVAASLEKILETRVDDKSDKEMIKKIVKNSEKK